jgi:hypothetical protein
MLARSTARRALPGAAAAALVLSCAALAGCGGSSGPAQGAASAPPANGSSSPAGGSASTGKLTGNFCNDFKNIGTNLPIPSAGTGGLAEMVKHDGKYLAQVAAYYDRLAAEAPPQVRQEIKQIASAYRGLAASITAGDSASLSKVEQQIRSLTTSGAAATAFKRLIVYLTTKCGPSEVSG